MKFLVTHILNDTCKVLDNTSFISFVQSIFNENEIDNDSFLIPPLTLEECVKYFSEYCSNFKLETFHTLEEMKKAYEAGQQNFASIGASKGFNYWFNSVTFK